MRARRRLDGLLAILAAVPLLLAASGAASGAALEGAYFATHFAADYPAPRARAFVKAYAARYEGQKPDSLAALGYDTLHLLADGGYPPQRVRRAGSTDGEVLKASLARTRGFAGVTGDITFDRNRDAVKPVFVVRIRKKQFRFAALVNP